MNDLFDGTPHAPPIAYRKPWRPAPQQVQRSATLSSCGKYRYRLSRRWEAGPGLLYVMLNPSTADAAADDATIRRCVGFAVDHGFGGFEVVNLYAWRATDPAELQAASEPVGPENDHYIREAAAAAGAVCLAYGAHAMVAARAQQVTALLLQHGLTLQCLAVTRDGYPSHPLCLPTSYRLAQYTPPAERKA